MILKKLRKDSRGQALVEFALVLPIAIFLLLCIMEGGRIFASYLELESAARDAARYASIYCSPGLVSDVDSWKTDDLSKMLAKRFNLLDATEVQIGLSRDVSKNGKEAWITVTLECPLRVTTPMINLITGDPFILKAKMVMRNEL